MILPIGPSCWPPAPSQALSLFIIKFNDCRFKVRWKAVVMLLFCSLSSDCFIFISFPPLLHLFCAILLLCFNTVCMLFLLSLFLFFFRLWYNYIIFTFSSLSPNLLMYPPLLSLKWWPPFSLIVRNIYIPKYLSTTWSIFCMLLVSICFPSWPFVLGPLVTLVYIYHVFSTYFPRLVL